MKKNIFLLVIIITTLSLLSSCKVKRSVAYKGMYKEKPLTILIMPPINKTTDVEAKEYFHATLYSPLANAGYYVIPPFLSMETLKKESAYDSELFINGSLKKFKEIFGADAALFTIIHKWKKVGVTSKINIEIEYILKSTKTNDVLYTRRGDVVYNTGMSVGGGLGGLVASVALSAANTALTQKAIIGSMCNKYTFKDLPTGKYSPYYGKDGKKAAGRKKFSADLN